MEQTSQTTATTRNVRVKAARLDHESDSCGIPTSDDWTKYETTSVWFTDRPITCTATPGTPILLGSFRIFLFSVAAFVAVGASLVIEFELTSRVEHCASDCNVWRAEVQGVALHQRQLWVLCFSLWLSWATITYISGMLGSAPYEGCGNPHHEVWLSLLRSRTNPHASRVNPCHSTRSWCSIRLVRRL